MLRIIGTIVAIQALAIGINLIRSKIVAVLLGPEGVGTISVIDQLVQLVTYISAFSLPFAAVRFLSRSHSKGFDAFKRSYSSFLRLLLLFTASGMVVSLAVVFWRPELLGRELSAYRLFLLPALIGLPLMALQGFFSNVLAAAQKTSASALLALVIALTLTITAYIGISLGGVAGLYWGNLLAGLLVVIGILAYLKRTFNLPLFEGRLAVRDELQENPDIVTFSAILYVTTFLYSLSYFVARYALLAGFGATEAGLLQAAIALAGALNLVLNPANGLYLMPILNRGIAKEEKIRATLEFQGKLMLAIGLLAMPLVLFPQWMVVLFFSPSFIEVSQVVFLFVIAQCIVQLAGVYQALIIGLDDLKAYGAIAALGHLSLGGLSLLLAPRYGLWGVAIGFLVSSMVIFLLGLARLSLSHGLAVPPRLCSSMGYGLLALLAAGATLNQYDAWQPLVVFTKVGLYCLFGVSLLFFLSREERQQLDRLSHKLFSRLERRSWRYAVGRAYRCIAKTFFVGG